MKHTATFILLLLGFYVSVHSQTPTEFVSYTVKFDESTLSCSPYETLIKKIQRGIRKGKIIAYDQITFEPLTELQTKELFISAYNQMMSRRTYPPYELYDTVIAEPFNWPTYAIGINFFELWSINPKGKIRKTVIGYEPIFSLVDSHTGITRGPFSLCFIYSNKKYRNKLDELLELD